MCKKVLLFPLLLCKLPSKQKKKAVNEVRKNWEDESSKRRAKFESIIDTRGRMENAKERQQAKSRKQTS